MFGKIIEALKLPELRKRVLVTVFLLFLVRVVAQVPLPEINLEALKNLFNSNQLFGLLDIFTGGALSRFSVGFMGVGPYITASIIIQLLTYIVPSLEQLQKEGNRGQQTINQYTRMLTVPLALVQSFSLILLLRNQGIIERATPDILITMLITATAGTLILMWLGEIISEDGIGNGISLIITVGILAGIPIQIRNTAAVVSAGGVVDTAKLIGVVWFIIISLATIVLIVLFNDAIRKVPITYARATRGRRTQGSMDTYLPIKVNIAGVIPIIFAISIAVLPSVFARFLSQARSEQVANFGSNLARWFNPNGWIYGTFYFLMVVIFTFFYTSIVFKPKDVAENLQKSGGFIPGVRPGKETQSFIAKVVSRITLPGAVFLGVVAILPFIVQSFTGITTFILGGTSILIIVAVVIETASQFRAHALTQRYEKY